MRHSISALGILLITDLLLSGCSHPGRPVPPGPAPRAQAFSSSQDLTPPAISAPPATAGASLPTLIPSPVPTPDAADGMPAGATPWWNDAVFYEVFVRSFADSSTGPLAGDGIGDLQGLIEKLDYLNDGDPNTNSDLGVTGIWLMPIMASPSYHGYDVTDYTMVNPRYGTGEDFKRLVEEAHRRGIRVIVDLVLNHTSSRHPWFQDAATPTLGHRDWYIWSETDPHYPGPWGETVWHPLGDAWYYGIFWSGMPDLNYRNPAVGEEMLRVTRFWVEEMGADGFRLDGVRHLFEEGQIQENVPETHDWLRTFRKELKEANPEALAVGEVWTMTSIASKYVGNELDLVFEFDLAEAILKSVNRGARDDLAYAQGVDLESFPPGQYATFLSNHDQNRTMTQLNSDVERAKLAAIILLTGPGVPFLYYGEEIGMTGAKPDEKIRTPMQWTPGDNAGFSGHRPWQPVNKDYPEVNVKAQHSDPGSLLNTYKKLIALRNAHPALQRGELTPVAETGDRAVHAFIRQAPEETVLVLINLGGRPLTDYALGLPESGLSGALKATELLHGAEVAAPALDAQGGFRNYKPISELAPRTGYVIRLTR
jgi:glycosidase